MSTGDEAAFPQSFPFVADNLTLHSGLSARAYIATKAMAAMISKMPLVHEGEEGYSEMPHWVSDAAVAYADALLAELAK